MGIFQCLSNNKIKILKYIITLVVIFFLLCVIFELFIVLFEDVYNTITLTYILLIVIINYIPEFSPYILNNYLIYIFPFLGKYSGRGTVYILLGLATSSPELNRIVNFGGYALIGIGLLCIYMNWLLVKNNKTNQDSHFKNIEKIEDLNYIDSDKNNNSGRNSTNSDTNDKNDKNGGIENNMTKYQEVLNNQNNEEKNQNMKQIEMKDFDK